MLIAAHVLDAFVIVASVCIVLLTVMLSAVMYAVYRAARQAQKIAERVGSEAERLLKWQRAWENKARFAGKWLRLVGEHILSPRD